MSLLFSTVLIIVVSIYMLLDMQRLARVIDRRFPPRPGSRPLMWRVEHSLVAYVKGQLLLSLIIGTSAGVGLWLLGVTGLVPGADTYALLFGLWVAFTELIPYLGPWLGAVPPLFYALAVHPVSAIWVAALFLFIHQVEGHVVVPNVMGSALRLHPLLVIFGLLAGGEIYGLPGIFVALPLLAVLRAVWEFFSERIELEQWEDGAKLPVEVDVEPEAPHGGAAGDRARLARVTRLDEHVAGQAAEVDRLASRRRTGYGCPSTFTCASRWPRGRRSRSFSVFSEPESGTSTHASITPAFAATRVGEPAEARRRVVARRSASPSAARSAASRTRARGRAARRSARAPRGRASA